MFKILFRCAVKVVVSTVLSFAFNNASAVVKLPPMVGDRMVLQRDTDLKIWGWADPGENVTVRFKGKCYYCTAGNDGRWSVTVEPQSAGGPFVLEVNERVIRDVLVGDVWLCSGQSNQETPIHRLTERFPEINVSNNHMIRHYKVPTQRSVDGVKENIPEGATWHSGVASDVMNWTALAYFFAQQLWDTYHVPVGMLVSSLGGSNIESWISQEHLNKFPELVIDRPALDSLRIAGSDIGAGLWCCYDYDDSNWPVMSMPGSWHENGLDVNGVVWMRKTFEVPSDMVGRHARIHMGRLVDSDSVFVNGCYVGSTGYEYPPRKYDIPANVLRAGKNVVAVKLTADKGNGEFVKDKKYGIVGDNAEVDLTGDWRYEIGRDNDAEHRLKSRLANMDTAGSALYNGMIYPLRDYGIKGVVWYQGESNADAPDTYLELLNALIANWRDTWQSKELPVLMVQLPNFMEKQSRPGDSGWARIREAQFMASKCIPNTSLAVTYDVGEWNDIHPLDKKTVAKRLLKGAQHVAYGENVECSGPVYESMKVNGDKIVLSFSHIGKGLTSNGEPLRHFAIAGADGKFVWGEAVIKGNTVVVHSPEVGVPVAVRYAWSDNPEDANLRNKDGLPASPFRTDNAAMGEPVRVITVNTSEQ